VSENIGLKEEAISSTIWATMSMAVGFVLRLTVMVVLARILSPEDFGIVAIALIIFAFSEQFSEMGFGSALIQRHVVNKDHIATTYTVTLFLGLIFCFLLVMLASPLAVYFESPELESICRVYSFVFLLRGFSSPSMALIQRKLDFKSVFWIDTYSNFIGHVLISISMAYMGYGYWALVVGNLVQILILALMSTYKVKVEVAFSFDKKSFGELWGFSIAQTITRFATFLAYHGDKFVISKLIGVNALGYYSRAYRMMELPNSLFSKAFGRVLFPLLSRAQNKPNKVSAAYFAVTTIIMFVVIPVSSNSSVFSDIIIHVVLGDQWGEAIVPFKILALVIFCKLGFIVASITATSIGGIRYLAAAKLFYGISVVLLSYLAYEWGIAGVATAVSLSMALHYVIVSILVFFLLKVSAREIIKNAMLHILLFIISYSIALLIRFYFNLPNIGYILQFIAFGLSIIVSVIVSYFLLRRRFLSEQALVMIDEMKFLVQSRISSFRNV
jgi:O-antigen/teichoic acid export membrane protein